MCNAIVWTLVVGYLQGGNYSTVIQPYSSAEKCLEAVETAKETYGKKNIKLYINQCLKTEVK
jgi:hypothetical protein